MLVAKVESLLNECGIEIKTNFGESNNVLIGYITAVSTQRQANEANHDQISLLFDLIESDYPKSSFLLAKAISKNVQLQPKPKAEDFPQSARLEEDTLDLHKTIQGLFEEYINNIQDLLL